MVDKIIDQVADGVNNLDIFEPNPLNKFASFNTLFTLSSLTRTELETLSYWNTNYKPQNIIARSSGIGDPNTSQSKNFTVESYDHTLASTTKAEQQQAILDKNLDAVRKVLTRGLDFYFQNVTIKTLPAASNDRQLTSVTTIDMEILEPIGLSLVQSIRGAAANAGFLDHIDAPYLLTIEYKGYDDNGKFTDIGANYVRKIPIKMIRMNINVSSGGSVYQIKAIPTTEFAFVDRLNYLRSTVIVNTETGNLSSFCKDLTTKLNNQTTDETKQKYFERPDRYVVTCDPSLDKAFSKNKLKTAETLSMANSKAGGIKINQSTQGQSFTKTETKTPVGQFNKGAAIHLILVQIMKLIEPYDSFDDYLKQWTTKANGELAGRISQLKTPEERDKFLRENEDKFYMPWFKISSSIHHDVGPVDKITKKHTALMHYHIEPYKLHILNFAVPGLSSNIQQFWSDTRRFIARKRYDYIFTGDNTEILSLDINYNIAYYQSKFKGLQQQQNTFEEAGPRTASTTRVYSTAPTAEKNLPLHQYPGGGKSSNVGIYGANESFDQFLDAFSNPQSDMVSIEMEIKGDPVYLSANQFNSMKKPPNPEGGTYENKNSSKTGIGYQTYDERSKSYNLNLAEPYVLVNFKAPVDIDLNTGLYKFNQGEDVIFNGLYRVVTIENRFVGGTFTQMLQLIRLKNQGDKVTTPSPEGVVDLPFGTVDKINLDALYNDFTKSDFTKSLWQKLTGWIKEKFTFSNQSGLGGPQETDDESYN
jgi:hypothetical protein